jgi:hypothetical protein
VSSQTDVDVQVNVVVVPGYVRDTLYRGIVLDSLSDSSRAIQASLW